MKPKLDVFKSLLILLAGAGLFYLVIKLGESDIAWVIP